MNENTGGIHVHERSAGLHERHHGKPCNRDRGVRFRVLAQQWRGVEQTIDAAFPHASHQGPRLSDGNKRIAIMPALTLLGMKRFVLDGHDLTEAEDKAVCLLIESVVCKDMTIGGSGPLPRE